MDELVVGRGPQVAIFRDASRSDGDTSYTGEGSFVIELRAEGLRAEHTVFMFSFDWDNLGAFFADLADSWKGWDGEKRWHSIEHDLSIAATSDSQGHCQLHFTVRDGPVPTWEVSMTGPQIDAGEDMAALDRAARRWIPGKTTG